jgi:TrmH family RNA methyltransferase
MRDPGNAGTVIRCADAFGADAVILAGDSVDPANSKAVRASAGSLFHLPVVSPASLSEAATQLRAAGLLVLAADGAGSADLADLAASGALARPLAWLMGNEAWGLPGAERDYADQVVRIPMWGQAESLNLAAAAAVCLYASAAAQRRQPSRLTEPL